MSLPPHRRVLLIEDDASIARFLEMALEELPLTLTRVATLAQARVALAGPPFDLVISDLMLPDGNAETLLAPPTAGSSPWLMLSAGLNPQRIQQLLALGAAHCLHKPVGLSALLDSVQRLLAGQAQAQSQAPLASPPGAAEGSPEEAQAQAQALAQHFGGDRALFESFRDGCLARFADDLCAGELACAQGDAPALRRVAHGLKSVLALIGRPRDAALAAALEAHAAEMDAGASAWATARAGWARLADCLR